MRQQTPPEGQQPQVMVADVGPFVQQHRAERLRRVFCGNFGRQQDRRPHHAQGRRVVDPPAQQQPRQPGIANDLGQLGQQARGRRRGPATEHQRCRRAPEQPAAHHGQAQQEGTARQDGQRWQCRDPVAQGGPSGRLTHRDVSHLRWWGCASLDPPYGFVIQRNFREHERFDGNISREARRRCGRAGRSGDQRDPRPARQGANHSQHGQFDHHDPSGGQPVHRLADPTEGDEIEPQQKRGQQVEVREPARQRLGETRDRRVHGCSPFFSFRGRVLALAIIFSSRSNSSALRRRDCRAWTRYSSTAPSKTLSRNPPAST